MALIIIVVHRSKNYSFCRVCRLHIWEMQLYPRFKKVSSANLSRLLMSSIIFLSKFHLKVRRSRVFSLVNICKSIIFFNDKFPKLIIRDT